MPRRGRVGNRLIGEIFVYVPKRAAIRRIDRKSRIVAPASYWRNEELHVLRTEPGEHGRFALGQNPEWVASEAARIVNGRETGWRRNAIAHSDVTGHIHRDAAHPAIEGIARCKRALLIDTRC